MRFALPDALEANCREAGEANRRGSSMPPCPSRRRSRRCDVAIKERKICQAGKKARCRCILIVVER